MPNVEPVLNQLPLKLKPSSTQAKAFNGSANKKSGSSFEGLIDQNAAAASDRAAQASRDKAPVNRTKDTPPPAKHADSKPANSSQAPAKPNKSAKNNSDKADHTTAKDTDKSDQPAQASDVNKSDKADKADKSANSSDDKKDTKDAEAEQSAIDAAAAAQLANASQATPDPNATIAASASTSTIIDVASTPKAEDADDAIAATGAANATSAADAARAANATTGVAAAELAAANSTAATADTSDSTDTTDVTDAVNDAKSNKVATTNATIQAATKEEQAAPVLTTDVAADTDKDDKSEIKNAGTQSNSGDQNAKVTADKTANGSTKIADVQRGKSPQHVDTNPAPSSAGAENGENQPAKDTKAADNNSVKNHNTADAATTQAQTNPQNNTINQAPPQNLTLPLQPVTGITAPSSAAAVSASSSQAPTVPLEGVPIAIANKAIEGNHHFEIRLDPPELGRIEVHLNVDRDGTISSHVIADRQDTLDLLRRDPSGLERTLQDAGLKTSNDGLQFSLRDHSNGQEQRQNGANTAHLVLQDESLPATEIGTQTYGRLISSAGGLDIRI